MISGAGRCIHGVLLNSDEHGNEECVHSQQVHELYEKCLSSVCKSVGESLAHFGCSTLSHNEHDIKGLCTCIFLLQS